MARFKRTTPPRPPAGPPASTKDGAAAVIKAAVKLFDRQDGKGVDQRLFAEILFHAAFDVLDGLPDDQRHPPRAPGPCRGLQAVFSGGRGGISGK